MSAQKQGLRTPTNGEPGSERRLKTAKPATSFAPRVQLAVTKSMAKGTGREASNRHFADGFDAHTGHPGLGAVLLEIHRLYSKMPPHWVANAFSRIESVLKQRRLEQRDVGRTRLTHRDAPHLIAGLAWGLAHRDTVEGLMSAAFLMDHLLGGKNKPEVVRREREIIRSYYAPIPRSEFSIKEVIRSFEAQPLPSSTLARAAAEAVMKKIREEGP